MLEQEENLILGVYGWHYLMGVNLENSGQDQECTDAASTETAQNKSRVLSLVHRVQAV